MNIGTYSLTKKEALLWLLSAAVMVAFISLGIWIHGNIMNGYHDKQRLYQTAIKTENGEEFNYSIDTRQGNIMTSGTFTFVDFVKFPEMKQQFSKVTKTEEEYTRHEEEVCEDTYDSEGNVDGETCHTEVSYSWDFNGSDTLEGQKVKFFEREYPSSMFRFGSERGIDASEVIDGIEGHYYYPNGIGSCIFSWGECDREGNIRYYYSVRDGAVSGSIFVNTSQGHLKPAEGSGAINVGSDTIEEKTKKAATEAAWVRGGFIALWVILTIGATIGVTALWHEKVNY